MIHDDEQVGRLLSRREALEILGAAGAALLTVAAGPRAALGSRSSRGPASPCIVRPEQTEGPYFVDEGLDRSDIRSDPAHGRVVAGVPLALTMAVSRLNDGACEPLEGARVDLWQCDAMGIYSDVRDPGFDTVGQKFLRGSQTTDASGEAHFITIYPGWYRGRTVHIHFKIRTDPLAQQGYAFTSQLYFDDELTDRVHALEPYHARGKRTTRNPDDGIYRRDGDQLLVAPVAADEGYAATFAIGLQMP